MMAHTTHTCNHDAILPKCGQPIEVTWLQHVIPKLRENKGQYMKGADVRAIAELQSRADPALCWKTLHVKARRWNSSPPGSEGL